MNFSLAQQLQQSPYQAYSYSYPHKTAYRPLKPPIDLKRAWAQEDKSTLFLYMHVPFCTMRCGFCNLFTLAQPRGDMAERYVKQMIEQMHVMADVLEGHRFNSFACGGGTPTFLHAEQLEQLFIAAKNVLGLDLHRISSCIEVSPDTASQDRLLVCQDAGIERVSMGLQSFYHAEVQALVRKQSWQDVDSAIERIRHVGFPRLNLDLIYGIPGQTVQTFLDTLEATLRYAPEELYLYPLYIRPLTGLNKITKKAKERHAHQTIELLQKKQPLQEQQAQDLRLEMYHTARDFLRSVGYEQVSMRMFKRKNLPSTHTPDVHYSCQNDGMVGLGCGARSYTRQLHYSEEYGIARARISDILHNYCNRDPKDFQTARYGFQLDLQEQQRRFVIQSLLVYPGLSFTDYTKRFDSHCMQDLPQLQELIELSLATQKNEILTLTDKGVSYADVIGPWLISSKVAELMQSYELI